ncbi:helix-turn-helix transcriptional regulator [Cytophagaceae bacterium YF14B1]|uniref:Helix-turn-helix transcriptional regulator n=1 Tax=Xanthocytophaga flava TaxID=3048013 RepID=A0AAE3UA31_9BACT|nr:helix-turn-helix transcriptional regulator [Xanthocytophaga flavus]MDJ1482883.1 helix-turn-helix transcriptional regulator [Xanthocytophaga flavus]
MKSIQPYSFRTITEYHQFMDLPKPEHPLVSVVDFNHIKRLPDNKPNKFVQQFYSISLKRNFNGKIKYGQQEYDFDEGVMIFISPDQVYSIEADKESQHTGWLLLMHPDFLWNTPLAKAIKQYEYFSYSVSEALHLSEKEEIVVTNIMQNIEQEYHANIDTFSQKVMIAHLELLLTYAERFYHRQFITRKVTNHKILNRLEEILAEYFNNEIVAEKGLPTVQYIADELHMSPNYLSSVLKVLTGQTAQQHIHNKLIDKAKERLSTTDLSVSEIAYELGFEHSQSFSKLFKSKTNLSPLEFRQSFQ